MSIRVVNKHIVFDKEQNVEWSWTTVNGESVAGKAGGNSLCMALQARLGDITVKARKSPWRVLSREWI